MGLSLVFSNSQFPIHYELMIPTITTIPIQHLASGDRLAIQVYQFI
ncbi:MAG: hypothetical protein F6K47_27445 [Symploca sp. SIO2E6]|nr:hypothetical protein [Symploca sp. SIO2E6]